MNQYEVITLPLAEEDIIKNVDYIHFVKQAPDTAKNLRKGFVETINALNKFPKGYEIDEDPELGRLGIRKCYYKNYKVYFYVDEEDMVVYVLRVLHMRVDAKPLLLNII